MATSTWLEKVESTAGKAKKKVMTTAGELKGKAESLAGKAKENGGAKADEMRDKTESAADRAKEHVAAKTGELKDQASRVAGKAQRKAARLRLLARMQGRADWLIGSAKETYGRALDKKRFIVEGKAQKVNGQALQQANR